MAKGKLDVQKKQHRERGQTLKRQKLGILEKHKDYVKRARDYHSKQDRLRRLQEKAASRNKDELYFGMIRSQTRKGVHVQQAENKALPTDLVKLLKTQDAGYIRTQRLIEEKRVARMIDGAGGNLRPTRAGEVPSGSDGSARPARRVVFTDEPDAADVPARKKARRRQAIFEAQEDDVLTSRMQRLDALRQAERAAESSKSSLSGRLRRRDPPSEDAARAPPRRKTDRRR